VSLLLIFSLLICIGSVTAQDSSNETLTIDESSPTDISQETVIEDENDITEDVEGISESSANEQNSFKYPHVVYYLFILFKDIAI